MPYIDWEYYSSLFENVTEQEFEKLVKKAQMKLDMVTHMRAKRFMDEYNVDSATDFENQVFSQIKLTMCELVNTLAVQESTGMGTGIISVSNDGYSESYKITTAAEKEAQLIGVIRGGLSGTGLAGAL